MRSLEFLGRDRKDWSVWGSYVGLREGRMVREGTGEAELGIMAFIHSANIYLCSAMCLKLCQLLGLNNFETHMGKGYSGKGHGWHSEVKG